MKEINNYTFFWKAKIAQWNMTPFYENGIKFNCAEQYMMAKKALLFKDADSYDLILNTESPKEIQKLGREVKNFNAEIWDKEKYNIVLRGNLLKFSQNKALRDILLETKQTILVEASPYDCVWGVGLSSDDPLILDKKNWRGENLLGKVLMDVRAIMRRIYE